MEKDARITSVLVIVCLLSGWVHAVPTSTSLVGDKDGFGIGVLAGQEFYYGAIVGMDADGTDQWRKGKWWWTHTYDIDALDGPVTSAVLEIFHGGDGSGGPSEIFLNDTAIGLLTDSDGTDGSPEYTTYPSIANLDVFDLTPYIGLLTGNDTVTVLPREGEEDSWVLDYSELRVSGGKGGPAVPVPGAALLALLGAGLVGSLRRRQAL